MNLIFLSTDGVLCNEQHLDYIGRRGIKYMSDTYNQIDKTKISLLNHLMNKVKASVYLTGSWKNQHSVEKINDMLKKSGANWQAVGAAPYLYKVNGKFATNVDEVDACLTEIYSKNQIDNFIILDDRNDWSKFNKNLIRVNYDKGLKPFHIERALDLFGVVRKNKIVK